jgi:phosphatidylglycerophosphatase A
MQNKRRNYPPPFTPSVIIATGFWSGYSPLVSGTCGSFAALLVWCGAQMIVSPFSITTQLIVVIVTTIGGLIATARVLKAHERSVHADPGYIVIDEWAGMFISVLGVPCFDYMQLLSAFALFRLFDILKPGPVNSVQKCPGAWGVMLDDVLAGVLALAVLTLVF